MLERGKHGVGARGRMCVREEGVAHLIGAGPNRIGSGSSAPPPGGDADAGWAWPSHMCGMDGVTYHNGNRDGGSSDVADVACPGSIAVPGTRIGCYMFGLIDTRYSIARGFLFLLSFLTIESKALA